MTNETVKLFGDDHDDDCSEWEEESSFLDQEKKRMIERGTKKSSFQVDRSLHPS
jgi:hypothetical protein